MYHKGAIIYEGLDTAARGKLHFALNSSNSSVNVALADAKMTIDYSGNVGIGSTSPAYLLGMESGTGGGYYSSADHQWHNASTRAIKQDISALTLSDNEFLLDKLKDLQINKFKFISDVEENNESAIWYYGVIADDSTTPDFLTGQGHNSLSTGGSIQFLLSVSHIFNQELEKLNSIINVSFASTSTPSIAIDSFGNVGIGITSFGTSAAKVLSLGNGTAPSSSIADSCQLWSADVNAAAGYSWLHGRDEKGHTLIVAGVVIKTDTGNTANPHEGLIEINTFDNKVYIYADAGWRQLATW